MVHTHTQTYHITFRLSLYLGPGISVQPGFYYRSVYKPLVISWLGGTAKCTYLDMTDRQEPPPLQVSFVISVKSF